MASSFRKFGSFLGLVEPDDEFYDEYEEPRSPREQTAPTRREREQVEVEPQRDTRSRRVENVTPLRATNVAPAPVRPEPAARIVTIEPRSFNEARRIGEEFRAGHSVLMNLTDVDDAVHRRLVDYASGLVHALEGKMEKVSRAVYIISPKNVEISDAERLTISNDGFFNQN